MSKKPIPKKLPTMEVTGNHHMLNGFWWKNDDKAQTHYLRSYLEERFSHLNPPPLEHKDWRVVPCPAGMAIYLPHKFYTIHTRDNTPANGRVLTGDEAVLAVI